MQPSVDLSPKKAKHARVLPGKKYAKTLAKFLNLLIPKQKKLPNNAPVEHAHIMLFAPKL